MYPLPYNITGFVSLTQYAQVVTEGWFGDLLLFTIFTVMFLLMKRADDFKTTFATAAIITLLFAVMLWILGVLSTIALILSVGLAITGVLIKIANMDVLG